MARCLNLTRAGEYAVAALSRLAVETSGTPSAAMSVGALAAAQGLPEAFLAKILARCSKAGLVRSKTGPAGGLRLGRGAERISLLEIIETCEGNYRREACVFYSERECPGAECEVYCPLRRQEESVRERLARATLAQMAEALKAHPENRSRRPIKE